MSTQSSARDDGIGTARKRIADCFEGRDSSGRLVQRRDALNLAGLGLSAEQVDGRFIVEERGLGEIGFGDLMHLRYLDLTGNRLERLPRGIGQFAWLQWLGLNFNRIASLSVGVGDWPELRCLYLRGNALRTLPEKASGWGQLVELDLFGNEPLASLPPGLVQYLLKRTAEQERRHVVLGKTALWDRMQEAGLKGEAEEAVTRAMLGWIAKQEHQPESEEPPSEEVDVAEWLRDRVGVDGGLRLARALAGLGLEDRQWFALLEDPAALVRRPWTADEFAFVDSAMEKASNESRRNTREGQLWETWYAAGLSEILGLDTGTGEWLDLQTSSRKQSR
jgi:Leucine-rich repeat (LRR) protein